MNILIKIEQLINKVLETIFIFIGKLSMKLVPEKFKSKFNFLKSKIPTRKPKAKAKTINKPPEKLIDRIKPIIIKIRDKIFYYQDLFKKYTRYLSPSKWKDVPVITLLKELLKEIKKILNRKVDKISKALNEMQPQTFLIGLILFFLIFLIGIKAFYSGRTIYRGAKIKNDKGTPLQEVIRKKSRTSYYKRVLPAKHYNIYNLSIPIYVESAGSVQTLIIDMTLETSNRYTREFIKEHTYQIKDRLYNKIEPMVPDLPLTLEGKVIIKNKIIQELNQIIKEFKVEGKIYKVHFQSIIAV